MHRVVGLIPAVVVTVVIGHIYTLAKFKRRKNKPKSIKIDKTYTSIKLPMNTKSKLDYQLARDFNKELMIRNLECQGFDRTTADLLSSLQDVDLPPFINKEKRNCN
jgi:hypothetical protein